MKLIQKILLIKECFPKSWIRKLPLIFLSKSIIFSIKGKLVALLLENKGEIKLLCVSEKYRKLGLATKLIKKSNSNKTYTFVNNKPAIKCWKKNGFKIKRRLKSLFGDKYELQRSE